jgi:hypothetical protein
MVLSYKLGIPFLLERRSKAKAVCQEKSICFQTLGTSVINFLPRFARVIIQHHNLAHLFQEQGICGLVIPVIAESCYDPVKSEILWVIQ